MPKPIPENNFAYFLLSSSISLHFNIMSTSSQEANERLGINWPLQLERWKHGEKETDSALENKDNSSEPEVMSHSAVDDWRAYGSL